MFLIFSLFISSYSEIKPDSLLKLKKDDWFSEDKFLHFAHSAVISSSIYLITNNINRSNNKTSFYISFSISSLLGISKEIKDSKEKDNFASYKDLVFDLAGILFGIFLVSTEK
ncbi:MAG: hypothetical protein ABIN61_06040 [candidate division WOR-3 bacterium]